jgi:sugar lactone lactonase YvrE
LYIGTLNFEGGPGGANVYRYDPATGATAIYAGGLTAITAIAFGPGGKLYVSEWTTGIDQNGPSPNGDVVVIPWGGGTNGRHVLGQGALHFPAGVAVTDRGVYVSNWSIAGGEDGPFGPGNHGQLVRIAPDGR